SVAPKHFLRPLFEFGIQARGLPVTRTMRLQIHVVKDLPHGARADRLDDTVGDGLPGKIGTGPMSDVQSFGNRLQASQLDDLGTLQGGKPLRSSRALGIAKYSSDSVLLIAATDAPDGGFVALQLDGNRLNPMTRPDRQKNAGMLDLEPRLRPA